MLRAFCTAVLFCLGIHVLAQEVLQTPNVESILYVGKGNNQPLIVGLGGSEGGNAWASDHWKATRDGFIDKGYAFLSLGYFGAAGTPKNLDRIAIEDVHRAIEEAVKNKHINKTRIALIGGSRGADLALLLGSYYKDINCVVAIVPSHAVFPGHTQELNTSCWTWQNKELPYIPVNEEAVPFLMKRDLRGAFDAMLNDTVAEKKALIRVENIQGPVLFLSATQDEICPSLPMCNKMMERLKAATFKFHYEHLVIDGGHTEPLKHFDVIDQFLDTWFRNHPSL